MKSLPKPKPTRRFPRSYQERVQTLHEATLVAKQIVDQPKAAFSDHQLYKQLRIAQHEIVILLGWLEKKGLLL